MTARTQDRIQFAPAGAVRKNRPIDRAVSLTMASPPLVRHVADLRDLARNVAGLSDEWLDNADADRMRQLIHEYRKQAREALGGGQ